MEKTLTVSVAAYNVEKYLEKTLNSIMLSGVLGDMEVIVVNDGSKDGTAAIAEKFVQKDPDSFKIINKNNGGWGSTVNAAIEAATGKYFKLLDGDDWFETENLAEFIDKLKNSECDAVLTDFTKYFDSGESPVRITLGYPTNDVFAPDKITDIAMHALTVKTEVLKKNGVKLLEHCFYTDLEFFIRSVSAAETIIYYPISVYCYRLGRDGQSVSVKSVLKHIDEHEKVMKTVIPLITSSKKLGNLINKASRLAESHVYYLAAIKPSKEVKARIKNYGRFIKNDSPIVYKNMSLKYRLVVGAPYFLYAYVSNKKRKELNLD